MFFFLLNLFQWSLKSISLLWTCENKKHHQDKTALMIMVATGDAAQPNRAGCSQASWQRLKQRHPNLAMRTSIEAYYLFHGLLPHLKRPFRRLIGPFPCGWVTLAGDVVKRESLNRKWCKCSLSALPLLLYMTCLCFCGHMIDLQVGTSELTATFFLTYCHIFDFCIVQLLHRFNTLQ